MSILGRFALLCFAILPCTIHVSAQTTGTCTRSLAEAYLDANNVRARIPSTGGLFYRGEPHVYNVPRNSDSNAIFAGSLWIAGQVGGQIRAAATKYGEWKFWAGPLDEDGKPPEDCLPFDRVYKVSKEDIDAFESYGMITLDLRDWPTGLGAQTLDRDGRLIDVLSLPLSSRGKRLIDLGAGERPAIRGDQSLWWIMNDTGNEHKSSDSPPLGVEVHGLAFAVRSTSDAINDATLYSYRIINRNTSPIEDAYVGIFLDPDLGNFDDDYVGVDTIRGIAYVYNSDNDDEGDEGYGTPPPALGVHLLEGPRANNDGVDNDLDGIVDEEGERLRLSHFMLPGWCHYECIPTAEEYYNLMLARWHDGQRITVGGDGRTFSTTPANFMFPGDPVTGDFWSEVNTDSLGTANYSSERRFIMSAGPFSLAPGEETDLTFSIIWARGTDYLSSITAMKEAADIVMSAFESGLENVPPDLPPQETVVLLAPADGMTRQPIDPILHWTDAEDAYSYQIQLMHSAGIEYHTSRQSPFQVERLPADEIIYWRVRGKNTEGFGSWSELFRFWTIDHRFSGYNGFTDFLTVQNGLGPLDPPEGASAGWRGFPGVGQPTDRQQAGNGRWIIATGMSRGCPTNCGDYESFIARSMRRGWTHVVPFDFEIRFTAEGSLHYDHFGFTESRGGIVPGDDLPFEIWNIGISTPDNPSDDFRMIPAGLDWDNDGWGIAEVDHGASEDDDDPQTDWFYWFNPADTSPGMPGYDAWAADATSGGDPSGELLGPEAMSRFVIVNLNGGDVTTGLYNQDLPEEGTVFRIETTNTLPTPSLAAPGYVSQVSAGEIAFYWNGVSTEEFRIQISDRSDFSTGIDEENVESGHVETFDRNGRYYWRIQRSKYEWSDTWTFEVVGGISGVNSEEDADLPHRYELFSNYPNPFNSSTIIAFDLPSASHVRLDVYDILGRRIQTLRDGRMPPGRHDILFDARRLSSGSYFYTLQADGFSSTKMMVLRR